MITVRRRLLVRMFGAPSTLELRENNFIGKTDLKEVGESFLSYRGGLKN